jgi:hypothetical protein
MSALIVGALVLLVGCGGDANAEESRWLRYDDSEAGFTVLYPETWNRSIVSLTPDLTEPAEILSLGTHTLRPGSDSCSQTPGHALDDMTELDAFITVQERIVDGGAGPVAIDFPPRPETFSLEAEDAAVGAACSENEGIQTWWIPFRDSGRGFYMQVAIGKSVGEETRRQVAGILKSLVFTAQVSSGATVTPAPAAETADGRRVRRLPSEGGS